MFARLLKLELPALAILILGVAAAVLSNLADPDYFWHLRTGQWIVENGRLPQTDPFLWDADGNAVGAARMVVRHHVVEGRGRIARPAVVATARPAVAASSNPVAPVPPPPAPVRTERGLALVQLAPNVYSLQRAPAATVATIEQGPARQAEQVASSVVTAQPLVALATVAAPPVSVPIVAPTVASVAAPLEVSKLDVGPTEALKLTAHPVEAAAQSPPARTEVASPAPWVVRAAHTPPPAAVSKPQVVRVMLSNASGSKVLAAYGAKQLRTNGVTGVQENEYHGDTGNQTVIFYREGHRNEAEVVLSMLQLPTSRPITIVATRFIPAGVDVRVVLGGHLRADRRVPTRSI